MYTHTHTLTAIKGAVSQIAQRLLAATAGAVSATPLVIVVTTCSCLHLLLQDQSANSLHGVKESRAEGRNKERWENKVEQKDR